MSSMWKPTPKDTLQASQGNVRRTFRANRTRFRPRLEPMEGRTLLSIAVTNPGDSGPGSLRQAIVDASDGDTINFSPNLSGATIKLTSGELQIGKSLDIEGLGPDALTIDGGGTGRVFDITTPGASVTIAGMTITDGVANDSVPTVAGGGIITSGSLTLNDCVVSGNVANGFSGYATSGGSGSPPGDGLGGGIYVAGGSLTLNNSVVSGNEVQGGTGYNCPGGTGLGGGV